VCGLKLRPESHAQMRRAGKAEYNGDWQVNFPGLTEVTTDTTDHN